MYRYRCELKSKGDDIALLFIKLESLSALRKEDVYFYPGNAASKQFQGLAEADIIGVNALETLFAEEATAKNGEVLCRGKLPPFPPTNPQAEVQIRSTIPWSQVGFIVVDGQKRKNQLISDGIHRCVYSHWEINRDENLDVFKFPSYWEHWRKHEEGDHGVKTSV